MKNFRQLLALPVLAMCAMLTLSACNNDPNEDGSEACQPSVTLGEAVSSRSGIAIVVDLNHAKQVCYAVLQRAADATGPATPTEADFKTVEVTSLTGGKLLIPSSELNGDGTYDIFAYGVNGDVKSKQTAISVVVDGQNYAPMLTFEVKNISPYSLDVQVNATVECAKYVATIIREDAYDADMFAASAELSLNATEDQMEFGVQAYKPFYASALIPESQLVKSSRYDSQECTGVQLSRLDELGNPIPYIVLVYGIDNFDNKMIYASEEPFTLPEPSVVAGPKVEIIPITTYSSVLGTFTASKECVKIVYSAMVANDKGLDFWKPSNDAAIQDFLLGTSINGAKPYSGTFSAKLPVVAQPGHEAVVIACGITADGKLTKFAYEMKPMRMPSFTGKAKPISVEAAGTVGGLMKWNIALPANANKMRVMNTTLDFFENTFVGTPEKELSFQWTMVTDESDNGFGFWQEYDAAEFMAAGGTCEVQVVQPSAGSPAVEFVLRVITSDASGNWGEIVAGPNQTVLPEGSTDTGLDFSKGTGQMSVTVVSSVETAEKDAVVVTYSVTAGANTKNIHWIGGSEISSITTDEDLTKESLLAYCKDVFTQQTADNEAYRTPGEQYSLSMYYPSNWGGGVVVFITEDNAGNFRPAAAIIPGKDVMIF